MDPTTALPKLLAIAWLLPLASFALIVLFRPADGQGGQGWPAIWPPRRSALRACCRSSRCSASGCRTHGPLPPEHHGGARGGHAAIREPITPTAGDDDRPTSTPATNDRPAEYAGTRGRSRRRRRIGDEQPAEQCRRPTSMPGRRLTPRSPTPRFSRWSGDWYTLGQFGMLRITIGYYIDALTVLMFAMVTFIATCIHFYAIGYMHDELHEVTDHEVHLHGSHGHGGEHGHGNGHGGDHGAWRRIMATAASTPTSMATWSGPAGSTASFSICRCSASACWGS